jgi:spermidine synthase
LNLPGREILRTHDDEGVIRVLDDGSRRYLAFCEQYEQSCVAKADPALAQHDFVRAMLLVLLFCEPRKALLFGLGGGALSSALHHHVPRLQQRVIELRPAVIEVAYRYFQLPRSKRLEVLAMDVAEYLAQADAASTDLLCSDLYGADGLDMLQLEPWFVERCHELLRPDGWLVLNFWREHQSARDTLAIVHRLFPDVRASTTASGNWVVLAGKRVGAPAAGELKVRAQAWSQRLGFSLLPYLARLRPLGPAPGERP